MLWGKRPGGRAFTYANVASTLAVFLALGGGAWAASGGFVSSKGTITGCVPSRGGTLRVVKTGAHCRSGDATVALAHSPTTGPRGPRGATGRLGPAGPEGPAGPGGYSIQLFNGGSVTFGGNQIHFWCIAPNACTAELTMNGPGLIAGTDERGTTGGAVTSTRMLNSELPATVQITGLGARGTQGRSHVTAWLEKGTGWSIDVEAFWDASLPNARLIGTAVPMNKSVCWGYFLPGPPCHYLPSEG